MRDDFPAGVAFLTASSWVAMSRDPASLKALARARRDAAWVALQPPAPRVWTDDHASIVPYIRWRNLLGKR